MILKVLIISTLWMTCIDSDNVVVNDKGAGEIYIVDYYSGAKTKIMTYISNSSSYITDVVRHPVTGMFYYAACVNDLCGIHEYDRTNNVTRKIGQRHYLLHIDDISLDWINNNIYYVERSGQHVTVLSIAPGNETKTYMKENGNNRKKRIVVDPRPSQGYFYVTSGSGSITKCNSKVGYLNQCSEISTDDEQEGYETSLTIDFKNDYLFYPGKKTKNEIKGKKLVKLTDNLDLEVVNEIKDDLLSVDDEYYLAFLSKTKSAIQLWYCESTICGEAFVHRSFSDIESISISKYQKTDNSDSYLANNSDSYWALPFDCKISGCLNGGSCNDNGDCSCNLNNSSFRDYQCHRLVTKNNCGKQCDSSNNVSIIDNVCLDSNQCLCKEGFYGQYCELERVNAVCSTDKMTISITPYRLIGREHFSGNIYLKNDSDFSIFPTNRNCIAYGGTLNSTNIYYDGSGACPYKLERSGEENSYKVYVYLQFDSRFLTDRDVLLLISCGISQFILESPSNVTVSKSPNFFPIINTTVDVHSSGMKMSLKMDDNGSIVNIRQGTTVNIGDKLYLVFEHSDPFTLRKCTASNYKLTSSSVPNGGQSIVIMDEWCVTNDGSRMVRNKIQVYDSAVGDSETDVNKVIRLDLSAFYFIGGLNSLFFSCTVCTDCQPFPQPVCNNTLSSYKIQTDLNGQSNGRKRRAADDVIDPLINLDVSVNVGNEKPQTKDLDKVPNVTHCYKQLSVLLPLCFLTTFMICAMSMTFYIGHRATEKNKNNTPPSYKS